ncbi:MAG: hypothetical protein EXR59_00970 [Dehalococcoidia bacterium]|nr:hypothetical protein [Dehalococcoidia bacterium]
MRPALTQITFTSRNRQYVISSGDEFAWKRTYAINDSDDSIVEGETAYGDIETPKGSEIHGHAGIHKKSSETWDKFVERSAQEMTRTIVTDEWPKDATDHESNLYFNLTYVDRNG